MTLTSDQVLEYSCPEHISYIILARNPKFGVQEDLGMTKCSLPSLGHCDL